MMRPLSVVVLWSACVAALAMSFARPATSSTQPAMSFAQNDPRAVAPAGPYHIAGTVVNATTGKPLDRVVVNLETPGGEGHRITAVQTDEEGRFLFDRLGAAKYALRASRKGFLTAGYDDHEEFATAIVTGEGLESDNLVFKLVPEAVIAGTVTDEAGDPIRRAHLSLYRQTTASGIGTIERGRQAMTDSFGIYEFAHLEPGNYFLSVSGSPWYAVHIRTHGDNGAPGPPSPLDVAYPLTYYPDTPDADAASPIPIRGGDRIEINMSLHPVPALHVLVHLPDNNGRAFSMPVLEQETMGATQYVNVSNDFTRVQNTVELSGIAPGHYQVELPGTRDAPARIATIDASNDQELDSNAGTPTVDVSGKIASSDGSPLPDSINVFLRRGNHRSSNEEISADGTFHIRDVAPGDYEVVAQAPGASLAVTRLTASGAAVDGHTIKIAGQAVTMSVSVADGKFTIDGFAKRNGKPAAGVMVVLVPRVTRGNREMFRRDQSDSDGSFQFTNVVPGAYTVVAIEDGWPLEWARPDVIAHYVPQGEAISVTRTSPRMLKLPQPVAVEAR
jgi:5-hydroxyisourate hydrolase-like protein (transthyretin family)